MVIRIYRAGAGFTRFHVFPTLGWKMHLVFFSQPEENTMDRGIFKFQALYSGFSHHVSA
jgi:hypothetical protein